MDPQVAPEQQPQQPQTPAPVTAEQTADEEFASAFLDAVATDDPAAPVKPVAVAPAVEPAAEPVAEPAAPVAAAPVVEPVVESPEAKMARLEAENATLRAPKPPEKAAEPAAAPVTPAAPSSDATELPAEPEWYKPSDDETALLKQYETEWPDIFKAQEIRTKKAAYDAVQYMFHQIAKVYNPQLQRFAQLADTISEQLQYSAVRGEHEDYDQIYDSVVAWVDTLPAAFKAGAKLTMENGSPQEVTELISEYKKQHPNQPATPAVLATPATPATPGKTISAAAKQAAGKLSVVGSKRTTPTAAPDKNDFEGSWAEAIGRE